MMNLTNLLSAREEQLFLAKEYGDPDAYNEVDNINICIEKILIKDKVPYTYKVETAGIKF